MVVEVKFADFGEGIHEGEILEWFVKEGETVKRDAELVKIHTEKMAESVTSPVEGKVIKILKQEGDEVRVGDVLVTLSGEITENKQEVDAPKKPSEKEEDPSLFKPSEPLAFKSFNKATQKSTPVSQQLSVVNDRVLASPAVRRRARERGVDLRYVKGSANGGRITSQDLENFSQKGTSLLQKSYVSGGIDVIPLRGTRKTIAKAMRRSKDLAAHYTYFEEVDMTAIDSLRESIRPQFKERGVKVTYVALVMKFLVPVLRRYPLMNSSLNDEKQEISIHHDVNIGISVDTEDGLIVPVVKNVEQKTVWQIAGEVQELAEKARTGKLSLHEITGSTFTITSIGNVGGLMATPIINWPNVAILGLMQTKLKPVVREINGNAEIVIRPIMNLSLSLDHRVVDGAIGAKFTRDLIAYMENPGLAWLESQ